MDAGLRSELEEKVRSGTRLSREDGIALLASDDLAWLGGLAHSVRLAAVGEVGFLAVARRVDLTAPEPAEAARVLALPELREVQLTGLNAAARTAGWPAALERLRAVREALDAQVALLAGSAHELHGLAGYLALPVEQLVAELRDAGVASLGVEGPELFEAPDAPELTEVHRAAHAAGLRTPATLPFGHAEDEPALVDRLLRIRELQDATGGFSFLAPLRYDGPDNHPATGAVALKLFALARLLLDNLAHVQVGWESHGLFTAQLALNHGADDVAGAVVQEAQDPEELTLDDLVELVRDAGCRPTERDVHFATVRAHPGLDPERRESPQPMRV